MAFLNLTSADGASAEGTGTIGRVLNLTSAAEVKVDGGGWPSWPSPPRIPTALEDAWFYGATKLKDMPGTGAARAGGTGVIS